MDARELRDDDLAAISGVLWDLHDTLKAQGRDAAADYALDLLEPVYDEAVRREEALQHARVQVEHDGHEVWTQQTEPGAWDAFCWCSDVPLASGLPCEAEAVRVGWAHRYKHAGKA